MKILLLILFGLLAGAGLFGIHLDSARLRGRVTEARRQHERVDRLREENRRTQELVTRSQTDLADATQAIHADVVRARSEVADLEKRAAERYAHMTARAAIDAAALENSRDPLKGFTRLEHFQNLGQATPSAAFQTLVWAAMKGDEAVLGQISTISSPARAAAVAMIARLPESARDQWTPEKFAAMFFLGALNEVSAAQILPETPGDAQHTGFGVRLKSGEKETTVPLQWQLGANGWQVVVDEKIMAAVQKRVANAVVPPPKK